MKLPLITNSIIAGLTLLFATQHNVASAQVDTIHVKDKRLNTAALKPGLRQYLVYFQSEKSPKTLRFWFWLRDTRIVDRKGEKVFATTQHWYGADTLSYRTGYSVNRVKDFSPVYHSETTNGKIGAYNWDTDKISGADTVALNQKKDFKLNFDEACFNWNLDIETFEMLPLAAGKSFAINFYDAGFGKPSFVVYKVTGSELITTYDGQKVDCWKLLNESDNAGRHFTQTFWISKKGHEFLKEEDSFPGGYRYKIKMPATAPDLVKRFAAK
ncbi:hypothetical protein ACFQZX_14475 [Mucilaginibacter litoreus]|uniref:Uncharacterized protein n=1 Tax=Mucilaginibacter litoreus TaxID=1048221 RepID=A0ABW3AVI5_9SPHI